MSPLWIIFYTIITFFSSLPSINSQQTDYPSANLSTSWINTHTPTRSFRSFDNATFTSILLRGTNYGPRFASGFYCNGDSDSYVFAVYIIDITTGNLITSIKGSPQVIWSANRNAPVGADAAVELTDEGELVLREADGTLVWSTYTAGRSVVGLSLTEKGNLVLLDANNSIIWQSFDHPTDCLLPGQRLVSGRNLTSSTNSTEGGLYIMSMTDQGLVASIMSDPPQVYYQNIVSKNKKKKRVSFAKFVNGSLDLYINKVEHVDTDVSIAIPEAISVQYMKLGSDGHLRVFEWGSPLKEVADIFTGHDGSECGYPMVCGKYGICSNGQCSCPRSNSNGASFRPIKDWQPNLGCSEVTPLTCNSSESYFFLDLENVTYFSFIADINNTDVDGCKEACSKNCSCKAAIFRYGSDYATGDCYLPSEIFSLMTNEKDLTRHNSSVSLKVQNAPPTVTRPVGEGPPIADKRKKRLLGPILGSILGVFCAAFVVGSTGVVYRRRRRRSEEVEEDYLDHLPGMPTRFSFEELVIATDNFNKKLGKGGFGSVFEGTLNDGTRIAVKRLDGVSHIKKSFLAEVETIGSIHHISLVRLIGFCAEKAHRLLVYEYMHNGSLDKWIYRGTRKTSLEWSDRRKIILDIAKGLAYLHEDCRKKIIHLDIKPQNILLDEHYNAKLADFGLSKLIERNQSKVVTTMRGTPGYLAPEWLRAVITEKVDVYSFGVVILEIVCGRKIFEQSRVEEERHLQTLFMKKAEEGHWLDLVDNCCQHVESDVGEIEEMMQIAALCLQSDHEKRPSMSMVIKVLNGCTDAQKDIDCNFFVPNCLINKIPENGAQNVTCLLPSLLSGPR